MNTNKLIVYGSILASIIAAIFIILYVILRYMNPSPKPNQPGSFHRDTYLDNFALKDAPPSTVSLTPLEQTYPPGLPQQFPDSSPTQTGTLVVTADTDNVRIILTTKDPGDVDLSGETKYAAPANSAPVRIMLPANYYTVVAEKDRYVWKWIPIVIEPNKVTRLSVHLEPANLQN